MKHLFAIVLLLTLPLLCNCSALPDNSLTVEQYLARSENFKATGDYRAAADALGKAIREQPSNGNLYLRQVELLEVVGRPEAAEKTCRKGLAAIPEEDPARMELSYRLLQLLTLKLSLPDRAQPLLNALPAGSIQLMDAQGCLAYGRNDYQTALRRFDQARQMTTDQDPGARILYHLALAYHQLGDDDHAMLALFHAVNQARSLGVRKDIETFFYQLRESTH